MAGRLMMLPAPAAGRVFPPRQIVLVKALACERQPAPAPPEAAPDVAAEAPPPPVRQPRPLPLREVPLSRFSVGDVLRRAEEAGIGMSYSTIWRLLHRDAIRPWFQKQWLFPRDPKLVERATPVLELYHRQWQGAPLGPRDLVLCGDELTRLQALTRPYRGSPTAPGREARYEFSHDRSPDTLCYLGFLDVFHGWVYGETAATNGIDPFERVLGHCLAQPRYQDIDRCFLIVDNGSAHHPSTSPARIGRQFPQVTVVHLPVHSSWLNQFEIYLSILKRKALTPADFADVQQVSRRIAAFQHYYNAHAEPFRWRYTRQNLEAYVKRLALHDAIYAEVCAAEVEQCRGILLPNTLTLQ